MKKSDYNRLSAIVDQFLIENDLGSGWFDKCLAFAYRGIREIKLDTWQSVKTYLLDVTDRKTATLPDEVVAVTKVGIKKGQYCITLGVNEELNTLPRTSESESVAGLLSQHLPNGIDFSQYTGYNFYNYNSSTVFGIGIGGLPSKGYYKVHDNGTCKELLLDYDYSYNQVYVECITDGFDECADPYIDPRLYDYVMRYMEERYEAKNNPKATESSIARMEENLYWAEKKVRGRLNNIDFQTLLNVTRGETRLTIKA